MVQANRRIAGLALLALLLLGRPALAQEVQIFEEAPPLDLLRSIMVPESRLCRPPRRRRTPPPASVSASTSPWTRTRCRRAPFPSSTVSAS